MGQEEFNIRFAVEAALELPGQAPKGLQMLAATQRYVEVRGLFKETGDSFARLFSHSDTALRDERRAAALAAAGRLAWVADDLPACRRYQEEALSIYRELGLPAGIARALADLGYLAFDQGEMTHASALVEEAAAWAAPLGDRRLTAHVQHVQAVFAAAAGDFRLAYDLDARNLAMYREEGDTWQAIIMAWAVGANAAALGEFKVAHEHLRECLQVGIELGNRWGASYPLDAFAVLAVAEKKYTRAARLMGAAEAQRLRSGLVPQAADHPALRAVLTAAGGDFQGPAVDAARREGGSLSLEAATAYAVSDEE
ncbi:hypothetical protein [Verrucomicrobium spinosum]|uniref:hypothetical protein n=1 Tax=Verrucomicrobium spinosum TaxID=2736 RepID=UPI0009464D9F|nr:hypothetical protein [Verrucomicrobium spinosum]